MATLSWPPAATKGRGRRGVGEAHWAPVQATPAQIER